MKFEIKNRWNGEIIFSLETESLKLCVEAAVKAGVNLTGANLSGADLSDANLTGANLSGADLSDANLSGADLSGADLSCADLSCADLSCANLSRAYLPGANLSRAYLPGAYLSRANLTRADLSGAYLTGAYGISPTTAAEVYLCDDPVIAEWKRDSAALKVLNELAKSEWGLKIVVAEKDAMISVYTAEDELPTTITISVAPTLREAIEKAISNKEGV